MTSCRDVELPSMPRAGHDISSNDSLGERPARVRANTIQSVKSVFQMKQRDNAPSSDKFATGSHWNIGHRRNANTIWHRLAQLKNPQKPERTGILRSIC